MARTFVSKASSSERELNASLEAASHRVLLAADRPVRAAFLARALDALADLAPKLDDKALGAAAGARSGYGVLLSALEHPELHDDLEQGDPLASARMRGIVAQRALLTRDGQPLTVDQVAELLHISRQAVEKRRRARHVLAVKTGRRGYLYPSWQFDHDGVIQGFVRVLAALDIDDPWMRMSFFLEGNIYLDGSSPLAELQRGNVELALRAARAFGEHGAA